MKGIRGLVIGLFVAGIFAFFSSSAFAEKEKGHMEGKVKTLKEAAAALEKSHPIISQRLTEYANEEAAEKGKRENEKKMEELRADRIKLLRDAAAALESSHPKLSERLTKMADRMAKRMEEKKEGKAEEAKENKKK